VDDESGESIEEEVPDKTPHGFPGLFILLFSVFHFVNCWFRAVD